MDLINIALAIGIPMVFTVWFWIRIFVSLQIMISIGSKVHNSLRVDTYGEEFGVGDIIGCFIHLSDEQNLTSNSISFFKNGVDQGVAYSGSEIPGGIYFPAVSLYMKVIMERIRATIFIINNSSENVLLIY